MSTRLFPLIRLRFPLQIPNRFPRWKTSLLPLLTAQGAPRCLITLDGSNNAQPRRPAAPLTLHIGTLNTIDNTYTHRHTENTETHADTDTDTDTRTDSHTDTDTDRDRKTETHTHEQPPISVPCHRRSRDSSRFNLRRPRFCVPSAKLTVCNPTYTVYK